VSDGLHALHNFNLHPLLI